MFRSVTVVTTLCQIKVVGLGPPDYCFYKLPKSHTCREAGSERPESPLRLSARRKSQERPQRLVPDVRQATHFALIGKADRSPEGGINGTEQYSVPLSFLAVGCCSFLSTRGERVHKFSLRLNQLTEQGRTPLLPGSPVRAEANAPPPYPDDCHVFHTAVG